VRILGTDFVMLHVDDLAAAARFYRDTLGLTPEIYSEEYQWAEFNGGNVTLALKGGAPSVASPPVQIAFAVADLEAVYEELRSKGVAHTGPPQDHGCCYHFEVHDPAGHTVILHQRSDGTFGQQTPCSAPAGASPAC